VRNNWKEIQAVAQALLEEESLEWGEWDLIVDSIDEGKDWRETLDGYRDVQRMRGQATEHNPSGETPQPD